MNEPPYYQMNRNNKRVGTSKQDTERAKQNKKNVLEQSALCPKALTDCLYSKKKTNGGKRTYKKRRRKRKLKTKRKKRYKGKSRKNKKKRNTRKKRR